MCTVVYGCAVWVCVCLDVVVCVCTRHVHGEFVCGYVCYVVGVCYAHTSCSYVYDRVLCV